MCYSRYVYHNIILYSQAIPFHYNVGRSVPTKSLTFYQRFLDTWQYTHNRQNMVRNSSLFFPSLFSDTNFDREYVLQCLGVFFLRWSSLYMCILVVCSCMCVYILRCNVSVHDYLPVLWDRVKLGSLAQPPPDRAPSLHGLCVSVHSS